MSNVLMFNVPIFNVVAGLGSFSAHIQTLLLWSGRSARRTLALTFCCLAVLVTPTVITAQPAGVGGGVETLTAAESQRALDLIKESQVHFLSLLAKTSDKQWNWKPNENRWSVGECAEHILRSNEALFLSAKRALEADENPEWETKTKGKTEMLLEVMPNRRPMGQGGATAPMEIRPTGEVTRQQIVERFNALYDELEEFVQQADAPLHSHTTEHPFPIFNTLSAYQWLIYVPLHTTRHSRQMVEVMETEGYPAN